MNSGHANNVKFRSLPTNDYYTTASDNTSHTYLPQSDKDYSQQKDDSYLAPIPTTKNNMNQQRTIAGNMSDKLIPLIKQNDNIPARPSIESNVPRVGVKARAPLRPPRPPPPAPQSKPDDAGDSYV